KITVQATYDDNAKHHESPTSSETQAVSEDTPPAPPAPNAPGITFSGSSEVTEGGKATYTVSLDNRALPQANSASELLHNLQNHNGILFGQQRGLDVSHDGSANSEGNKSDVFAMTGHYPSIIGLAMMETPMERGLSAAENGKRMADAIKKIDSVGSIASISAHWDMPGGETDRTKVDLKRLLPGGDQNAELNGWLDTVAEMAKHAVRDDGTKIPFIFRPLHEGNGEWAWWYYERGGAETYKELFRYIVNYLKEHGADGQMLTAFAPNGNFNGDESRYNLLYPGDDVVDILGYDAYDTNKALPAKDKWVKETVEDMAMLSRMAAARGKVAALAEFGLSGDKMIQPDGNTDLTFYTDLLKAIKADPDAAKIAYMMTWANWGGNPGADYSAFTPWPGHEMEADFQEFARQMTMTRNADRDITVDVTIQHGTTDDGDIQTTTRTVTIPKGQNSATFTVDAVADGKAEGDEHYTVKISNAQGGQIEAG
uniref:glycosyl hydrolase n=1 Tax=uncultured Cardiobacterium sp. TaxID=417619 RepID=UPI00260C5ABD